MGLKALLTLDLEKKATDEQRKTFNEKMAKLNWFKIKNLTTAWQAEFEDNVSLSVALATTKSDVTKAIKEAKVLQYHAVVQFGNNTPSAFSS